MMPQEFHQDFMLKVLRERLLSGITAVLGAVTLLAAMAALMVVTVWDRPRRDQFWHRMTKPRRIEHLTINDTNDNGQPSDDGALLCSLAHQHREHVRTVAAEVNEWRTMQSEVRSQLQALSAAVRKVKRDPSRLPSLMKVD